jgi:tRNA modification GTPase
LQQLYTNRTKITNEKIKPLLLEVQKELEQLLLDSENGKIIKNGINVAIIGKPNVGKSSILNHLLEENKAIVTNIPGTTRDAVEGKIMLNGIILNVIDTAGIRETEDIVEKIGVEKSIEISKTADLIIYVLDNATLDFDDDLKYLKSQSTKKTIVFINKDDLETKNDYSLFEEYKPVKGNTVGNEGLEKLKKRITELFNLKQLETKDYSYLSNARQISLVRLALDVIEKSLNNINDIPIDMLTIDLRICYDLLGEIIGETYKEDLLEELFSKFCLGK